MMTDAVEKGRDEKPLHDNRIVTSSLAIDIALSTPILNQCCSQRPVKYFFDSIDPMQTCGSAVAVRARLEGFPELTLEARKRRTMTLAHGSFTHVESVRELKSPLRTGGDFFLPLTHGLITPSLALEPRFRRK
jgi:hypothetical protein